MRRNRSFTVLSIAEKYKWIRADRLRRPERIDRLAFLILRKHKDYKKKLIKKEKNYEKTSTT